MEIRPSLTNRSPPMALVLKRDFVGIFILPAHSPRSGMIACQKSYTILFTCTTIKIR
jgi:hypothetical protein